MVLNHNVLLRFKKKKKEERLQLTYRTYLLSYLPGLRCHSTLILLHAEQLQWAYIMKALGKFV